MVARTAVDVDASMVPASAAAAKSPSASLDAGEIAARVAIVIAFGFLTTRFAAHFLETGHITGLMLLASEALVVILTVFRRTAGLVDRSVRARVVTSVSVAGPLFLIPVVDRAIMPEIVTATFSACGVLVAIAGKLSLGRSFGLMPANRGVVCTGLYRLVRHPIYMGYLITHVGFIAANPSSWNVMMLITADMALMIRAVREERVLARDAAYRDYQQKVCWRVVPGLF
jgi:protein-S-isoprenylcysteine O-methyltransferase Ste14